MKICPICGTEFEPHHHNQKFCSPKCVKENKREIERKRCKNARPNYERVTGAIQNNLKPFDVQVGDTIKTAENGKFEVTAIYKHHFAATNGKWTETFTIAEYQTGEVVKV